MFMPFEVATMGYTSSMITIKGCDQWTRLNWINNSRDLSRGVYAPKGQDEKAQGNALGHATTVRPKP
jgi:hypothetical protein